MVDGSAVVTKMMAQRAPVLCKTLIEIDDDIELLRKPE
jgi:hypothetical protein